MTRASEKLENAPRAARGIADRAIVQIAIGAAVLVALAVGIAGAWL